MMGNWFDFVKINFEPAGHCIRFDFSAIASQWPHVPIIECRNSIVEWMRREGFVERQDDYEYINSFTAMTQSAIAINYGGDYKFIETSRSNYLEITIVVAISAFDVLLKKYTRSPGISLNTLIFERISQISFTGTNEMVVKFHEQDIDEVSARGMIQRLLFERFNMNEHEHYHYSHRQVVSINMLGEHVAVVLACDDEPYTMLKLHYG